MARIGTIAALALQCSVIAGALLGVDCRGAEPVHPQSAEILEKIQSVAKRQPQQVRCSYTLELEMFNPELPSPIGFAPPKTDVTNGKLEVSIVLDDRRVRLEERGTQFNGEELDSKLVFDGQLTTDLNVFPKAPRPLCSIGPDLFFPDLSRAGPLLDIVWMFAPQHVLHSNSSINILPGTKRFAELSCVVAEFKQQNVSPHESAYDRELYFDPERDYLLMGRKVTVKGKLHSLVEFFYHQDFADGRFPKQWFVRHGNIDTGRIYGTAKATITKYDTETPIADSDFTIDIPVGSQVYDNRTKVIAIKAKNGELVPVKQP